MTPAEAGSGSFENDPRKWWALAVILLAQLMIILDIAIVNVAVPSAQADLHIPPADIQWVVTAYLLPFGGLLLLGGRIADYSGRKRVFCIATIGFAVSSGLGGAAGSPEMLFAARACQGFFAAAMAPSLLSMMSIGFPSGQDRARAFSLFGGISAIGGATGLILGGFLTEYISWRWSLLINVPISLIVVAAAIPLLRESRAEGSPTYDVVGAILGTLGLLGVIYGISQAAEEGWTASVTVLPIAAGVLILTAFVAWEARVREPLLPLGILANRVRASGFLLMAIIAGPMTALTLLVLVYLQGPGGEGPLGAGLHFTPIPVFGIIGALASMKLLPRVRPWILLAVGSVLGAAGMTVAAQIDIGATFWADLFPGFALMGLGTSVLFIAANAIALVGVRDADTGLASAVINDMQQVGAALGVAILSTISSNVATDYVAAHGPAAAGEGIVQGNHDALLIGAGLMLTGGLVAALLIKNEAPLSAPDLAPPPERRRRVPRMGRARIESRT